MTYDRQNQLDANVVQPPRGELLLWRTLNDG